MKKTTVIQGQHSWSLRSDTVSAHLTCLGGHLGPVTFRVGERAINPFSTAPWAEEELPANTPPILTALRGDFFCCPFGIDRGRPYKSQAHPPHGETCNTAWTLDQITHRKGVHILRATLSTHFRPGAVTKEIVLRDGHQAIYQRHTLHGLAGPLTLGHHPMLKFPDQDIGLISTSGFSSGHVFPEPFGIPAEGSYSALKPAARFTKLNRVPLGLGGHTALDAYPARRGYDDIVQLLTKPVKPFAWTAVAFPNQGYAWFSLKDPKILNSTLLWLSNGGRYAPPWNGRHTAVLGTEEITGYFDLGVAASLKPNAFSRKGHATILTKKKQTDLTVTFVMALAAIPENFGRITAIKSMDGGVTLHSRTAPPVQVPLDTAFLQTRLAQESHPKLAL